MFSRCCYRVAISLVLVVFGVMTASGAEKEEFVRSGKPLAVIGSGTDDMRTEDECLVVPGGQEGDFGDTPIWQVRGFASFGWGNTLEAELPLNSGDFDVHARLTLPVVEGTGVSFIMGGGYHTPFAVPEGRHALRIWLDGAEGKIYVLDYPASRKASGAWPTRPYDTTVPAEKYPRIRKAGRKAVGMVSDYITPGEPFDFHLAHSDGLFVLRIDDQEVFRSQLKLKRWPANFGFLADRGTLRVRDFWAEGSFARPNIDHTDLWMLGHDGYNTYRIPAICTTGQGTTLAFAEARRPGSDGGEVDCVMKRSTDGGDTWSQQQMLWDTGRECFFARDPSPVVDRKTGTVLLLVGSNVPRPGSEEIGRRRLFLMTSEDDGQSWSAPRPLGVITDKMKYLTGGPGRGIQLTRGQHEGRLVVPCYGSAHDGSGGSRSCVVYSDDHGKTWILGGSASTKTNECAVVELEDGTVLLSCRDSGEIYLSEDGGESFELAQWKLSGRSVDAQLLRYSWSDQADTGGKSRVLFSLPGTHSRRRMLVKMSYDDCKTWPVSQLIYPGGAAYSGMAMLPDGRVGLVYEKDDYRSVSFVRFKVDWLLNSK